MHTLEPGLDEGGYARLDVSDLLLLDDDPCNWCGELLPGGGEYLVVADNRHFHICPTCWGRSAGYVELRHAGFNHEAALARIATPPGE